MKAFLAVMFLALASAQLPPMMSSYMPYGGMPIVSGPPVHNSPPMVSRPPVMSGPTMMSGPPMLSGTSIVSGPINIRDDSCVVRCVRQCQNDQGSSTLTNLRTVDLSGFQPNQGNSGNNGFNMGLNTDFQSGLTSETSRLTIAPTTKGSSSGQIAVKG